MKPNVKSIIKVNPVFFICLFVQFYFGLFTMTANLYIHETKLRKAIQLWSDMRNFDSFNSFCNYRCIF